MIDIDVNTIPKNFNACIKAECPMTAECLRYQAGEALMESEIRSLKVLNPKLLDASKEGGCEYFRSVEKQVCGKGFVRYLGKLSVDDSKIAILALMEVCSSQRQYYRYRTGELFITPNIQELMNDSLKRNGIEQELTFDSIVNLYSF